MKIVHVIVGLGIGGAELMLKRLVQSHLGKAGYQHIVISLTTVGKIGQQLRDLGVEVHALGMRSAANVPGALWRLVFIIRRSRPDVVQTWMYHADLLGGVAARLAGNSSVVWGLRTTQIQPTGPLATLLVRSLCAKLSYFVPRRIVCAANASRRAHVALGYDASRMVVVSNGFDLTALVATSEQKDTLRRQCGFGADVIVIGFLGRFHPDKGPQYFVRAAGLVAEQHKSARFLMIGRGIDFNNKQLADWIHTTGVAERFVLLGERDDVPVCLAAMDLFCLSSRTEGFPNVVGEAMAMGVPCTVSDVGDAAMLVADSGVVVPTEDAAALARGLGSLLAMSSYARQALGAKAKARIHSEFSMEFARLRFESIYKITTSERT